MMLWNAILRSCNEAGENSMPDVYANITEADPAIVERLAQTLELRAAEPAQRAIRESYFADIPLSSQARVLELGCGTGPVARHLNELPNVAEVIGIDPSPQLLEHARRIGEGISGLSFQEGDARQLPFPDGSFDVVVGHTVFSHIPEPEGALAEAFRVLKTGGSLAVFDADFPTASVAIADNDPLQAGIESWRANVVHDPWFVRRSQSLVEGAGFGVSSFRSHGYVQTREPSFLLRNFELGVDFLEKDGTIGNALAEALKQEAKNRVEEGRFFVQISFASLIAQRPG
jgi:ubiquinone/menaquinone biosynthesis C-methylase UbiE